MNVYICMYVCMYICMSMYVYLYVCIYVRMVITYRKVKDQPVKVANPARGQLNRENEYFPASVRT